MAGSYYNKIKQQFNQKMRQAYQNMQDGIIDENKYYELLQTAKLEFQKEVELAKIECSLLDIKFDDTLSEVDMRNIEALLSEIGGFSFAHLLDYAESPQQFKEYWDVDDIDSFYQAASMYILKEIWTKVPVCMVADSFDAGMLTLGDICHIDYEQPYLVHCFKQDINSFEELVKAAQTRAILQEQEINPDATVSGVSVNDMQFLTKFNELNPAGSLCIKFQEILPFIAIQDNFIELDIAKIIAAFHE